MAVEEEPPPLAGRKELNPVLLAAVVAQLVAGSIGSRQRNFDSRRMRRMGLDRQHRSIARIVLRSLRLCCWRRGGRGLAWRRWGIVHRPRRRSRRNRRLVGGWRSC